MYKKMDFGGDSINDGEDSIFDLLAVVLIDLLVLFSHSMLVPVLSVHEKRDEEDEVRPWNERGNSTRKGPPNRDEDVSEVVWVS